MFMLYPVGRHWWQAGLFLLTYNREAQPNEVITDQLT